MEPAHRGSEVGYPTVIIVREWESQMSSSGCCGRLEGDLMEWSGERCFAERRAIMEDAGGLYTALDSQLGGRVNLVVLDPRNTPAILATLVGEFFRHRVPAREMLRTVASISLRTVIVNGRVFSSGAWPPVQELVDFVRCKVDVPAQEPHYA